MKDQITDKEGMIGHYVTVKVAKGSYSYSDWIKYTGTLLRLNGGTWIKTKDDVVYMAAHPEVLLHHIKKCELCRS